MQEALKSPASVISNALGIVISKTTIRIRRFQKSQSRSGSKFLKNHRSERPRKITIHNPKSGSVTLVNCRTFLNICLVLRSTYNDFRKPQSGSESKAYQTKSQSTIRIHDKEIYLHVLNQRINIYVCCRL